MGLREFQGVLEAIWKSFWRIEVVLMWVLFLEVQGVFNVVLSGFQKDFQGFKDSFRYCQEVFMGISGGF